MIPNDAPDPAYARLRRRSLAVALPAVLGVAALLALVSWKQGLLTATRPLYFMATSASGITRGMPVKLNGFVVGQVAAIELLPPSTQSDHRVRVALDVFRRYLDYVPKTSRARLAQEGMIGQSVIELVPERYDARAIHGGEVLPFERSRGLAEIAGGLEAKITPVLDDAHALTSRLAAPDGDLQGLLAAGRGATEGLVQTNAEVQRTLVETRRAIATIAVGADRTLARTDRVVAAAERDVPAVLGDLRAT
ncbi:MlaD family protein, partial [Lysobacter xanthus]